jgi:hypothetical protein
MLNSDENREKIISAFPKLKDDSHFKITKRPCPDYNCFAWAANHDDVFWTPLPEDKRPLNYGGVSYNWPFDQAEDTKPETMIRIFSKLGYVICENGDYEDGYRKIALYIKDDNITHAARQLVSGKLKGLWTSKLGQWFEIIHGTAYTIEGDGYGTVIQFMRMSFP